MQRLEHDDDELDENDDGLDDRCDKTRALALKAAARVDAMAKKYSLRDNHHSFALQSVVPRKCLETEGKDKRTLNILPKGKRGRKKQQRTSTPIEQ